MVLFSTSTSSPPQPSKHSFDLLCCSVARKAHKADSSSNSLMTRVYLAEWRAACCHVWRLCEHTNPQHNIDWRQCSRWNSYDSYSCFCRTFVSLMISCFPDNTTVTFIIHRYIFIKTRAGQYHFRASLLLQQTMQRAPVHGGHCAPWLIYKR